MSRYMFSSFCLDLAERQLLDNNKRVPLTPKAFDVLVFLVERGGHLVEKDELMRSVWPDSFVEEANISRVVHTLRKALGEDQNGNKFIETVAKSGYRFVASTVAVPSSHVWDATAEQFPKGSESNGFKVDLSISVASQLRHRGEYASARDHAKKCLESFQAKGDRLNMAKAYREIGVGHLREGNCIKSLSYFERGIDTIGESSAPDIRGVLYVRGVLYTDMAWAHWQLGRPKEGIACLDKAVECFNGSDRILRLITAQNNLGLALIRNGNWKRAEETLKAAVTVAEGVDSFGMPSFLDSLAELKILKGEYGEAKRLLLKAIDIAKTRKKGNNACQAMRNLGRCFLAQGQFKEAIQTARDAIALCDEAGDLRYAQMSHLVLAESYLNLGGLAECQKCLVSIEDDDITYDYFVLGDIQRIRGLFSLEVGNKERALDHFSRCRKIFDKASDIYHVALADYLIGANLPSNQNELALEHLTSAHIFFKSQNIKSKMKDCAGKIKKIEQSSGA